MRFRWAAKPLVVRASLHLVAVGLKLNLLRCVVGEVSGPPFSEIESPLGGEPR